MNYGNKRVLITGATGLIGKDVIDPLLNLGFDVFAITIDNKYKDSRVTWLEGSLFNEDFIKKTMEIIKPQYLLNLAWITTGNYLDSNVNFDFLKAGINLLKYFSDNNGKRIIFTGTCFEYKFKDSHLAENNALDTTKTTYTYCKNELHKIAEFFCKANNISYGYGRIFYVYGQNEDKTRLTGLILDNLTNNKEVIINNSSLLKDYMYTKDIANALATFLDSNVEGVVNICTGKSISLGDFATLIAKKLNKQNLLTLKNEPTSQPNIIVGDNKRLLNEVKYNPKYTLENGITEIIDALKKGI